jgi:lysophospholipase L1-like esterase
MFRNKPIIFKTVIVTAFVFSILALFTSCWAKDNIFETYVAIGDSLTQGSQGMNVEENRQYYSFPAQLARQMDTEFNQPLVEYPGVVMPNPEDALREGWADTYLGTAIIMMKTFLLWKRVDGFSNQKILNNFGMSGATLDQMLGANILVGQTSPIVKLIGLVNPSIYSLIGRIPFLVKPAVDQALDRNPTFISVWAGTNDTSFSTIMGNTVLSTPLDYWEEQWNILVEKIKATESVQGVIIINIPDNTAIPFSQTVNNPFHEVKEGVDIPEGSKVPFFVRKTSNIDQVLTPDEIIEIQDRIAAFNEIIKNTCEEENWAMFDCYTFWKEGISGEGIKLLNADGTESDISINDSYGTGGFFSLDGSHPTSAGYAVMSNLIATTINEHYGTTLPLLDEVAVWEQDSLCQNPIDPRESDPIMWLFNTMRNMFGIFLLVYH